MDAIFTENALLRMLTFGRLMYLGGGWGFVDLKAQKSGRYWLNKDLNFS